MSVRITNATRATIAQRYTGPASKKNFRGNETYSDAGGVRRGTLSEYNLLVRRTDSPELYKFAFFRKKEALCLEKERNKLEEFEAKRKDLENILLGKAGDNERIGDTFIRMAGECFGNEIAEIVAKRINQIVDNNLIVGIDAEIRSGVCLMARDAYDKMIAENSYALAFAKWFSAQELFLAKALDQEQLEFIDNFGFLKMEVGAIKPEHRPLVYSEAVDLADTPTDPGVGKKQAPPSTETPGRRKGAAKPLFHSKHPEEPKTSGERTRIVNAGDISGDREDKTRMLSSGAERQLSPFVEQPKRTTAQSSIPFAASARLIKNSGIKGWVRSFLKR